VAFSRMMGSTSESRSGRRHTPCPKVLIYSGVMLKLQDFVTVMLCLVGVSWSVLYPVRVEAKENKRAQKFRQLVTQNMTAAQGHYWGFIDCKNRDKIQGMPTATIPLPGAGRTWVDASGYTTHHVFEGKADQLKVSYRALRERLNERLLTSYTLIDFDDSSAQWDHKEGADDHVSVGIQMNETDVTVTFYPPLDSLIPNGNPCM
jgi:hypothetical protein